MCYVHVWGKPRTWGAAAAQAELIILIWISCFPHRKGRKALAQKGEGSHVRGTGEWRGPWLLPCQQSTFRQRPKRLTEGCRRTGPLFGSCGIKPGPDGSRTQEPAQKLAMFLLDGGWHTHLTLSICIEPFSVPGTALRLVECPPGKVDSFVEFSFQ